MSPASAWRADITAIPALQRSVLLRILSGSRETGFIGRAILAGYVRAERSNI